MINVLERASRSLSSGESCGEIWQHRVVGDGASGSALCDESALMSLDHLLLKNVKQMFVNGELDLVLSQIRVVESIGGPWQ